MDSENALTLRQYGASPGSHSHGHFQILVSLSGTLELEVQGRGMRLPPGAGCVIEPGARHDFASSSGSVCLVLDSAHSAWAHCAQPTLLHTPPPAFTLAHYLASAVRQGLPLAQTHGPSLLLEAWLSGSADKPRSTAQRRPIHWEELAHWALQPSEANPLTVVDLAQRVHLSPAQFSARCHSENGMSAMAWLRSLRLQQAALLRAGGMAVADVARRTGYRSPSALTAALRRSQGG